MKRKRSWRRILSRVRSISDTARSWPLELISRRGLLGAGSELVGLFSKMENMSTTERAVAGEPGEASTLVTKGSLQDGNLFRGRGVTDSAVRAA